MYKFSIVSISYVIVCDVVILPTCEVCYTVRAVIDSSSDNRIAFHAVNESAGHIY